MALSAGLGGSGPGRRRRGRARRGALSEINVTPLVDVMLVLLIIFMVSATIMNAGIKVDLPKTEAAAVESNTEPMTISIRKDGAIFIQKDPARYAEIAPRLERLLNGDHERAIFVRADAAAPYEAVARVMARLSTSGFTHINLITDTGGGDTAEVTTAAPIRPVDAGADGAPQ
ncbi:MAG: ExbD/TolR family protein [Caulobacteraceae bacterium]|nr:ExbD/TolR family protein [Caulobacteraceae bacterium]